uniref:Spire type actin nucleation factor 2 n=1 Tax=Pelusios castaneus TaxID=367368 RepID=A0A8C8VK28_9SAUR
MAQAGSSGEGRAGGAELSLEEVLKSYEQPINEEQAWAVCYQRCRGPAGRVRGPADILLHRDGAVSARGEPGAPCTRLLPLPCSQMVQSLGFTIYRALDWGLDESEERELSPQLEQLIDLMTNSDSDSGCAMADEGYGGQDEDEEAAEGPPRAVRTFRQAMRMCAARLTAPQEAQTHYQAVCRALFVETMELKAFLAKIRDAKELKDEDEAQEKRSADELDNLRNTDWARLWVQLMRELRHGVKLKKVQEKQFDPLPTEYQLTPFEMLMQDIRARNYRLRKVMVDGDIPPRVKKDAHELILDFIRSRPPLKQVTTAAGTSKKRLSPWRGSQLAAIDDGFGSLPCIHNACSTNVKSSSCINLSVPDSSAPAPRPRPRVLLKAPTLAEMEEMIISEVSAEPGLVLTLKRDRSFSEQDLAQFQSQRATSQPDSGYPGPQEAETRPRSGSMNTTRLSMENKGKFLLPPFSFPSLPQLRQPSPHSERSEGGSSSTPGNRSKHLWLEFSHPVETLALTVEEMINVRRVLVKAEMEKFLQSKELYSSLKKGKICCCCRTKFPLFSWPPIKMPSKKLAHIPVYALGFENLPGPVNAKAVPPRRRDASHSLQRVEEEFPHIYAHGSVLKDICRDCSSFVTDVICSSRKSMDILNATSRKGRKTQSLYIQPTHFAKQQ